MNNINHVSAKEFTFALVDGERVRRLWRGGGERREVGYIHGPCRDGLWLLGRGTSFGPLSPLWRG